MTIPKTIVVWTSLALVALAAGQVCAHEGGRPDFLASGMLSECQFRENMHLSSEDLPMNRCRSVRVDVRPEGLAADELSLLVPAVGVELSVCGHGDILHLSDNWFWLDPGETRDVDVSFEDGKTYPVVVNAFNMKKEGN